LRVYCHTAFLDARPKSAYQVYQSTKYAFVPDERLFPMTKSQQAEQRAHRLAAKLRENLKRRKGQIKARDNADAAAPKETHPAPDQEAEKP
jgi:hypothetical protein